MHPSPRPSRVWSPRVARRLGLAAASAALLVALVPGAGSAATLSTCRASAARVAVPPLTTLEPIVANAPGSPCATDNQQLAVTPVGPLTVNGPIATTRAASGVIAAHAEVASVALTLAGLPVGIGAVAADQTISCANGQDVTTGSSHVDALTVLGVPVPLIAGQTMDLNLGLIRVRTNIVVGAVRQALVLDAGTVEIVLGEAQASGSACATLTTPTPTDPTNALGDPDAVTQLCPVGSTYRATDNVCVIGGGSTSASGTDTPGTTVVSTPYAGPSGGSVLTLAAALALVRAGKLADSACLHGKGPNYVLVGAAKRNDRLVGTGSADRILGLSGNDTINSGGGADCVDGGAGNDTASGGAAGDALIGGAGNDTLAGGAGNDRLSGGAGRDRESGGAGNDTIVTGSGADRVSGGAGRDTINAANARVTASIDAGAGRDTVRVKRSGRKRVKHAEVVRTVR